KIDGQYGLVYFLFQQGAYTLKGKHTRALQQYGLVVKGNEVEVLQEIVGRLEEDAPHALMPAEQRFVFIQRGPDTDKPLYMFAVDNVRHFFIQFAIGAGYLQHVRQYNRMMRMLLLLLQVLQRYQQRGKVGVIS